MSRIGIFDSGVGGLTVQRAILDALPSVDTVYLGDTARVPYGTKSADTVTQYSLRNARFLARHGIDLLVVACNTASAVALPALRAELAVPVLGVVEPGARAAARGIAERPHRRHRDAGHGRERRVPGGLRAARPDAEVVARACPLFVPLAEEGWTDPGRSRRARRRRRATSRRSSRRASTRSSSAARTTRCSRAAIAPRAARRRARGQRGGDRRRGAGALRGEDGREGVHASSSPTRRRSSSPSPAGSWAAPSTAAEHVDV